MSMRDLIVAVLTAAGAASAFVGVWLWVNVGAALVVLAVVLLAVAVLIALSDVDDATGPVEPAEQEAPPSPIRMFKRSPFPAVPDAAPVAAPE